MTRALIALRSVTTIIAGVTLAIAGARCWGARARAHAELSVLATVSGQTRALAGLQAGVPPWMRQGRVPTGLAPRITAALTAAGLPASAVSSVSPEAESPLGEAELSVRRTRAVLTLAPLTLPQLGGFLAAWRSREPQWTVSSIELSPQQGIQGGNQIGGAHPGGDLPLRAVLGLETQFVDHGGGH